jgi:hypothetical protein
LRIATTDGSTVPIELGCARSGADHSAVTASVGHSPMKQILMAYAAESASIPADIRKMKADLSGNVSLCERWADKDATQFGGLDEVVLFFSAGVPSPGGVEATQDGTPVLDEKTRAAIPADVDVLMVVSTPDDRKSLPVDLNKYDSLALSVRSEREALLCRIAHEPVRARSRVKVDAASAIFKVTTGIVATLVGSLDRTRDFLVANLPEPVPLIVHFAMVATVVALLFTGLFALVRIAYGQTRQLLGKTDTAEISGGRGWMKWAVVGSIAVAVAAFGFTWFPNPPSIDRIVVKHLAEWAHTLKDSQDTGGGILRKGDDDAVQVWTTAQALAGVMDDSLASSIFSRDDYHSALNFIDRARIDGRLSETPAASPEGWGYFEPFRWGVTEVAAWVALCHVRQLRMHNLKPPLSVDEKTSAQRDIRAIVTLLLTRQIERTGAFSPIVERDDRYARTYSTIMSMWAVGEALHPDLGIYAPGEIPPIEQRLRRAMAWIVSTADTDGWKPNPGNHTRERAPLGLTAQTLFVVHRMPFHIDSGTAAALSKVEGMLLHGSPAWRSRGVETNDRAPDSDRYLLPTDRVTEGSTFLWYPWAVALMRVLVEDPSLSQDDHKMAVEMLQHLRGRVGEYGEFAVNEYNYVPSEGLISYTWPVTSPVQGAQSPPN